MSAWMDFMYLLVESVDEMLSVWELFMHAGVLA